jgi:hypothetical protein
VKLPLKHILPRFNNKYKYTKHKVNSNSKKSRIIKKIDSWVEKNTTKKYRYVDQNLDKKGKS